MAEPYYIAVAPHNPLGPIATAICIHFALVTPNFLIQEAIRADVPWRDAVATPPRIVDSHALPYAGPGLGIEVDEEEAARHPFAQEELLRFWHDDGSVADW
jgi:galactonate dehydratase